VIAVRPSSWLPYAFDRTKCGQHEHAGPRQTRLSAEPCKVYAFRARGARSRPRPDAMNVGFHGIRTPCIRGFIPKVRPAAAA
jgi:hypothetical protein